MALLPPVPSAYVFLPLHLQVLDSAIVLKMVNLNANLVVKNSEISGMIDLVQGTDDFPAKPNPVVIERCISGLNSENAIMIGDRVEDVWAALALDIPAIGIAQSAHSEDMLSKSGAIVTF